jgi:hypothetical protein
MAIGLAAGGAGGGRQRVGGGEAAAGRGRQGGLTMVDYSWPDPASRRLIGKRIPRLDGPAKVTGAAKYTYDVHRPGMLYAKVLRCPHAHARVVTLDLSQVEKIPGVRAVLVIQGAGLYGNGGHAASP